MTGISFDLSPETLRRSQPSRIAATATALFALIAGLGLAVWATRTPAGMTTPPAAELSSSASLRATARVPSRAVEAAAWLPVARALGAREPRFWIGHGDGASPALGATMHFSAGGVTLLREGQPTGRVALSALGRPAAMFPVTVGAPAGRANQISFRAGQVDETFLNTPLGLEQTFTVNQAPRGSGPLEVSLDLTGLRASGQGDSVTLAGPHLSLRYGDLIVRDATGRRLGARLVSDGRAVRILIQDRGATYPLHVDPLVTEGTLRWNSTTPFHTDHLGSSVAVSSDGSTIAVGASGYQTGTAQDPGADIGAIFIFDRPSGGWSAAGDDFQPAGILTDEADPGGSEQALGTSIAMSADGSTIVTGGPTSGQDYDAGMAFVFTKTGGAWSEATTLTGSDTAGSYATSGDQFGTSVAVDSDGGVIAVGAPGHDAGTIYTFTRPYGGWAAGSGTQLELQDVSAGGGRLGQSVAIDAGGDLIAGGAPLIDPVVGSTGTSGAGEAFVFSEPSGGWTGTGELEPVGALSAATADLGGLGDAITMSQTGAIIGVGAPGGDNSHGTVGIYLRPSGGWGTGASSLDPTATLIDDSGDGGVGQDLAMTPDGSEIISGNPYVGTTENTNPPGVIDEFLAPAGGWTVGRYGPESSFVGSSSQVTDVASNVSVTADGGTVAAGEFAANNEAGAALVLGADTGVGTTPTSPTTDTGTTTTVTQRPSATQVNCSAENVGQANAFFACTAQVADASNTGTPLTPTGTVSFSVPAGQGGLSSNMCQLTPSQGGATAFCSVNYFPPSAGLPTGTPAPVTAAYSGDSTFAPSSAGVQSGVTTPTDTTPTDTTPTDTTPTTTTSTTTGTTTTPTSTGTTTTDTIDCDQSQRRSQRPSCPAGVKVGSITDTAGNGNAYVVHPDGSVTKITAGTPIYAGDTIVTQNGSAVALTWTIGGAVPIGAGQSITVAGERNAYNASQTATQVAAGKISNILNLSGGTNYAAPGPKMMIQTNGGVIGIKG